VQGLSRSPLLMMTSACLSYTAALPTDSPRHPQASISQAAASLMRPVAQVIVHQPGFTRNDVSALLW
jgi:hypothetical protein